MELDKFNLARQMAKHANSHTHYITSTKLNGTLIIPTYSNWQNWLVVGRPTVVSAGWRCNFQHTIIYHG